MPPLERSMRSAVRRALRRFGYDVVRHDSMKAHHRLRVDMIRERGVDVVLDVGASSGHFSAALRANGFSGRIVSFEPLSSSFADLEGRCRGDPLWECRQIALGDTNGTGTLNVAGNGVSSSLHGMEERHVRSAPRSAYVGQETCAVRTLDSIGDAVLRGARRAYLKVDVQGSELAVLVGAEQTLPDVDVVEAEISLVPLYADAPSLDDVVRFLDERGFGVRALLPTMLEPRTKTVLQIDATFARLEPHV